MNTFKQLFFKVLPLIIIYLLFIATFLGESNYEAIIALTASIPLIFYVFNKDLKIEKILLYILYVFAVALFIYFITLIINDYHWFSFCLRNYYNETIWSTFKWNQFFIYDLKYLIYIGVIFLAIKNKKLHKKLARN